MKDAKTIVRNYRIVVAFLGAIFIGIIVFLNFLKLNFTIHILLVLCVFVIYRIISLRIIFKQIHSILLLKFDAPKYKEVIFQKGLRPNIAFQLDSAAYNGEYQTVINLCNKVINGKFKSKFKPNFFACMARAYYEMGDMKNLEYTCNTFDEFLSGYNKKINPNIKLMMRYYRQFVLEDYQTCFSILEELNVLRKDNSRNGKISKIFTSYNYGVLCYKTGDFDNAIMHFNNVIETAPKLQNAKLSQKYIDAINNSVEFTSDYDEVLPDNDYEIPFFKFRKRMIFAIKLLIIIEILILILISIISKSNYESKIRIAVDNEYDDFVSYEYFNVNYDKDTTYGICVVEKLNSNYDICFICTYDDGKTLELYEAFHDLNIKDYFFESEYEYSSFLIPLPDRNNKFIWFQVFDSKEEIPKDNYGFVDIIKNENSFYLVATEIS